MDIPTRQLIHMTTAIHWSYRSKCSIINRKVGAVITDPSFRQVLSVGYNGPAKGLPVDFCRQWAEDRHNELYCKVNSTLKNCLSTYIVNEIVGAAMTNGSRCPCLHAEDNAIAHLHSAVVDPVLFVTMQPCEICAQRIVNAGIKAVYYWQKYRRIEGVGLLQRLGIAVHHMDSPFLDSFNQLMSAPTLTQ
jgi:deoxycytidylate deaminase